jgi:hypothetical protein
MANCCAKFMTLRHSREMTKFLITYGNIFFLSRRPLFHGKGKVKVVLEFS